MVLEACVESFEEAVRVADRGADRIELCSRLDLDGLTPPAALVRRVCQVLAIPVMVMIRLRPGSFVCTREEITRMEAEAGEARELGASGIVFGLLTGDRRIATEGCERLVRAAFPLPVTFHKAIDELADPVEGVRQLRQLKGITRILTSGGKPTALEGAGTIREMIAASEGRPIIVAAGKVTAANLARIALLTGAPEFHGRKIVG